MIASLRGRLLSRLGDGLVVIEVGGVGYRVTMTPAAAQRLGPPGDPGGAAATASDDVFVWVHHHVREDAEILYGFPTLAEQESFEVLIGTHGVGPSMGLAILGTLGTDELTRAVVTEDSAALCRVPGVGRKTAARLIVELGSRLSLDLASAPATGSAPPEVAAAGDAPLAEVSSALAGLGYSADEISKALKGLPADVDAASGLRSALKILGGSRG